ncbi:mediator of RNA polymerase II transcription subunit 7 [Lacticaseibacillus saniviri]|nr:mediator of RNA polymerase II transcription subunit 7 [Lacticaseibacillus saniviri]
MKKLWHSLLIAFLALVTVVAVAPATFTRRIKV